jgi:hypothetical protein
MTGLVRGHLEVVKLLLGKYTNADLEILDADRRNILHYAIQSEDANILKVRKYQCWGSGSGSVGSVCFWASWIRNQIR